MKKVLTTAALSATLIAGFATGASAHVTNEKTLYDDIMLSDAKEEVVKLSGLGIVSASSGANLYNPDELLTNADLGVWLANYYGIGSSEEGAVDSENAALVVKEGLLPTLEGNATYEGVNFAYFGGEAELGELTGELTRGEFAIFVEKNLTTEVDGETLLEAGHIVEGPKGVVESVDGEDPYVLTIDGQEYAVSHHPKVLNVPTDLNQLEGVTLTETYAQAHGEDGQVLVHLVGAEDAFTSEEVAATTGHHDEASGEEHKHADKDAKEETEEKGFPIVPVAGGVVLVALAAWLIGSRKK